MSFFGKKMDVGTAFFLIVTFVLVVSIMLIGNVAHAKENFSGDKYAIKANGEVLAVVGSEYEAKIAMEEVVKEYTGDFKGTHEPIEPTIVVEPAVDGEAVSIDEAKGQIIEKNDISDPYFKVVSKGTVTLKKTIKPKTVVKKDSSMKKGTKKVVRKGKSGITVYKKAQTLVNGEVVKSKNIERKVVKASVSKVVKKGTKTTPSYSSSSSRGYSGNYSTAGSSNSGIIGYAKNFLGNPYVYGGNSLTGGIDCSGFVKAIWGRYGVSLPRTSYAMRSVGHSVSLSNARPGDIVCYSGHVALYAGNGSIIHAANPRAGITMGSATYRSILTIRRV